MSKWYDRALEDSNYDVTWDLDEMNKTYTCRKCGRTYTLDQAFYEFSDRFNGDFSYNGSGYDGTICGHCAADEVESDMVYFDDD